MTTLVPGMVIKPVTDRAVISELCRVLYVSEPMDRVVLIPVEPRRKAKRIYFRGYMRKSFEQVRRQLDSENPLLAVTAVKSRSDAQATDKELDDKYRRRGQDTSDALVCRNERWNLIKPLVEGPDGVLYLQNAASSSLAYILAMAVLYDSVDDALLDLTSEISPERLSYGARRTLTVEDWDDQKALETYCLHRGSAADIARNLSISVLRARRLLSTKGLPDLGRMSNDPLRVAVKLFYLERASWDAACERSGVNRSRFEAVVRTAGSNLCAALSMMDKQTNAKPEVQLRPKPLSPLDPG